MAHVTRVQQQNTGPRADRVGVKTLLLLMALWGSIGAGGLRRWWGGREGNRQDAQVRALLAGAVPVVPAQRQSLEDLQTLQNSA